jgi:MoxR-like ATPase
MARYCGTNNSEPILRAAEHWREKALLAEGSVFSARSLWRDSYLSSLQEHFVDHPDTGEGNFLEKLEEQLSGTPAEVKQLTAEMLWLMFLCPSNVTPATKRKTIRQVWGWSGEAIREDIVWLKDDVLAGVGSAGASFGIQRWRELTFFVRMLREFKKLSRAEQDALLSDGWKFGTWLEKLPDARVRQLRPMFLYLLFPDTFERIFGGGDRRQIVQDLTKRSDAEILTLSPLDIDRELARIRAEQQQKYPDRELDFYVSPLKEKWRREEETRHAWLFQANPGFFDIDSAIRALPEIRWVVKQHSDRIRAGDRAFIWRSGEEAGIIAQGQVVSDPAELEAAPAEAKFVKNEDKFGEKFLGVRVRIDQVLDPPVGRDAIRKEPTLANLSILRAPQGTNFAVTREETNSIERLIQTRTMSGSPSGVQPSYSIEDFAKESRISAAVIESWQRRLQRKKHIVFQGPPGTGKTFVAERLARLMVSGSIGIIEVVQFHPSYAYEDFVQGIRPQVIKGQLSFEIKAGRFLEFCDRAVQHSGAPCVLIIDEINRANLSRVFGELMYLLEYRNKSIPLSGSGQPFRVPDNVYVVGTMNTADRSIALVDHALRRRFSFIYLGPDYDVLKAHLVDSGLPGEGLVKALQKVNAAINDPNYEVGISFFLCDGEKLKSALPVIWEGEIEPYLEEYFFDQREKVDDLRWGELSTTLLKDWSS